jgi:hypothetical protein
MNQQFIVFILTSLLFCVNIIEGYSDSKTSRIDGPILLSEIVFCSIGLVLNAISLGFLLTIRRKINLHLILLNAGMNMLDLTYLLYILTVTIFRYNHNDTPIPCTYEYSSYITYESWSMWLVVGLLFVFKRDLWDGIKHTLNEAVVLAIVLGIYSIGLSISIAMIASLSSTSSTMMDESLSYCILNPADSTSHIVLYILMTLPIIKMIYNFRYIFLSITISQEYLREKGIMMVAKGQYIDTTKRVGYIMIGMVSFYFPTLIVELLRITNGGVQPYVSGIVRVLALLVPAVSNPVIFVLINRDMQENVKEYCSNVVSKMSYHNSVSPYIAQGDWGKNCPDQNAVGNNATTNFTQWQNWLLDYKLKDILIAYAEREYVSENFLFYCDVHQYCELGKELTGMIDNPSERKELAVKWLQLATLANKMYLLYIKVTTNFRFITTLYIKYSHNCKLKSAFSKRIKAPYLFWL